MIQIPGFKISEELYNGNSTIIYRAKDEKENKSVIIKLLKSEYPSPDEIKDFKYEYEIQKSFNSNGIVKIHELLKYNNTYAIVMEDFNGISLDKIIKDKKISIKSFLVIGVKIASILSDIHKSNIIHKDIKPHNILLNPETVDVKIIDFSISSQLSREVQSVVNPGGLEGTISYISPEQTGRMNRSVDYRTDFYSLGVTFYELLTNKLPFESNDTMEIVHSHIAKMPESPKMINKDIPDVLSAITMKLMEKNAEDRYQSAFGLKCDLEECYKRLKEKGEIDSFEIGANDVSEKFQIPEKLYGRQKEVSHLLRVFENVTHGSKEVVFFTGGSGIGKSV